MFFKTCATLALATAAAAKPILAPRVPKDLTANRRSVVAARNINGNNFGGNVNDFGGNGNEFVPNGNEFGAKENDFVANGNEFGGNDDAFDFMDGFDNYRNQDVVIQVQQENVAVIQNGNDVRVIQESVNQVLVIDQEQNRNQRDINNLFRKSSYRNNFGDKTTVILVVTEVQIKIDDGRGNQVDQRVFAQSVVVANRGQQETETVMIFEARTLVQQDIINGNKDRIDQNQGFASPTENFNAQQTADIQVFGEKPSWTAIAEDPAATLGAVWEAELRDAQDVNNNAADNEQNKAAAEFERQALEDAQNQAGEQNVEEEAVVQTDEVAAAEDVAAEDVAAEDVTAEDEAAAVDEAAAAGELAAGELAAGEEAAVEDAAATPPVAEATSAAV